MVPFRPWPVLLATALALTACERSKAPEPAPGSESSAPPELPQIADSPLDREALLLAVAQAASDFAAGHDDRERQQRLDGRRFEVRLRFGCPGEDVATRQWSFEAPARVLRVRVEPELSETGPAMAALGLGEFESVEGFWIRRPWMLAATCPVRPAAREAGGQVGAEAELPVPSPPEAPPPRIAVAHFFTDQDSRLRRRDERAYEATVKLSEGEQPSGAGYDLVLSGRLAQLPDARVIACAGDAVAAAPLCVVSVDFDRVALVRPDGELIAEWSSG